MPLYRMKNVLEAKGVKAFLNLETGVTHGLLPDNTLGGRQKTRSAQNHMEKQSRKFEQMQEQLSNKDKELESTRHQLADRDKEISRLQKLNSRQAVDMDQKTAEINRRLYDEGMASESSREAREASYRTIPENSGPLYLDLLKRCLTDALYGEDREQSYHGTNPSTAHTLLNFERLDNLQACVEDVLANNVSGDLIETGVWRGGATIFMRAILKAYDIEDRHVWVADSFEGFPFPDAKKYPCDEGDLSYTVNANVIPSLEQVKANFQRYGLLDAQVRFLKGWFRATLPEAPIRELAVARLDGDMYESTMDALVHLYPKLSVGGYLIIDDYGCFPACRQAVHDYRESRGINEDIQSIDWTGVFWQRLE